MAEAKAGDELTAKAAAKLRKKHRMMAEVLTTKESCVVQTKTKAKDGQWICITCGDVFDNNMQAHGHPVSHKLAWWTNLHFEEP